MSAGTQRYPQELKARAVQMVIDARGGEATEWATICRVADLLGIGSAESFRKWLRRAEIISGERAGFGDVESETVRRLRRENAELKRANAILKAASALFRCRTRPATPVVVKFIGAHRGHRMGAGGLTWGVEPICAVLSEHGISIAPSTFYEHLGRSGPSKQETKDDELADHIFELRQANPLNQRLGSRKTWIRLHSRGVDVSRCSVKRVMRDRGWRGANTRKTPKTTITNPAAQRAPDRAGRKFTAAAPNGLWVADFTYCRTCAGWAYTAFVVDVFARKIVGWKVSSEMTQQLVTDAINQAIDFRKRSGTSNLDAMIHHSDAGSQGGFNWSSQHRVVSFSVVGRQRLPPVFATPVFCGAGC